MGRLLRRPQTEEKTGLKHSEIYKRAAEGTFPKPVRIGAKAVAWVEDEIDQWIESRVAERDRPRRVA